MGEPRPHEIVKVGYHEQAAKSVVTDKKSFAVYFDDGAHSHQLSCFNTLETARSYLESEVARFQSQEGEYANLEYLGEEDEEFDFELALLDEEGIFEETILFWNPRNGYHSP